MSEGNESALRFSLEESVWFQKGQEVSELFSISLDPDIIIHENDQYVTIEGSLQLTGEYSKHEAVDTEEEEIPSSPKFVQTVEQRGKDVFEFIHHFPVDITIPVNRVKSIEEIDVKIDSFDYHLPERSCLKLVADLTIGGLFGEQQNIASDKKEEETPVEIYRPSLFEKEKAILKEIEETQDKAVEWAEEKELLAPFSAEARKKPEREEPVMPAKREETTDAEIWHEESHILHTHLGVEDKEISFSARKDESPAHEVIEEVSLKSRSEQECMNEDESPEDYEESSSSPSSPDLSKKKKKKSKKDGISLAEFFARKEDDEDVTRLKVCIVQSGDTVDNIAERYDVTVQSILKVNDMEMNQDVYTGQVLYIPDHVVHR